MFKTITAGTLAFVVLAAASNAYAARGSGNWDTGNGTDLNGAVAARGSGTWDAGNGTDLDGYVKSGPSLPSGVTLPGVDLGILC